MVDPVKSAKLDQDVATVKEVFPPLWRGLYDGCIEQGFTESQAMELVKTFIMSNGSAK